MSSVLDTYRKVDYNLPKTARCWQLSGTGFEKMDLVEIPRPQPGPDDVAFRVDVNSICFSDVKVVTAGKSHPRLVNYDVENKKVVPGHEIAMTIVEVGKNVASKFKVGDRFMVQADMLKYGKAVGYDVWGGYCDYGVFAPEVQEYLIPITEPKAGYSETALVEPWACVEASYARVDIGPMDEVVWLCGGAGPMGQMHLVRTFAVKKSGQAPNLKTVLLTDIIDARLESVQERYSAMAQDVGVRFVTLNPNNPGYEKSLDEIAPNGFNFLVALCPVAPVIQAALKRLKQYGVVNLFAGFKRGEGALNMGDVHYDQITISGNSGSRIDDMYSVLSKVQAGFLNTNSSVYAVVGLEGAKEGVMWVRDGKAFNKIVIYPQCKDLPLTPISELAGQLPFAEDVREQVRKGHWSTQAEEVLLASKWTQS